MTRYIELDALVAGIEKCIYRCNEKKHSCPVNTQVEAICDNKINAYNEVLSLLDTIKVKEVDLEEDVRQIISLYHEGIKYYEDVIRKEREENGGSDLAIKIMDGVVDARELSIQYVIDKLKAQKGE